ncbi:MAG: hypothetical protein ACRDN9_18810 [Streptosporangiaceae bacterium]
MAVIVRGRIVADGPPATLGGRASAAARVSWRDNDGSVHETQTDAPTSAVADLGARYGGEVPGLTVSRPSLEDVYLEMIGERR